MHELVTLCKCSVPCEEHPIVLKMFHAISVVSLVVMSLYSHLIIVLFSRNCL